MKKKLYYQQVVEKINNDTGEITTTKVVRAYKDKKESETYYKVNENLVISILKTNVTKKEISLFLLLGNYMNYGNEIVIDLKLQEEIGLIMGISPKTIKNYVYSLHKKDFMVRMNENRYLINPNYIGKGNGTSLENVKLLYCELWRKQQLNTKVDINPITDNVETVNNIDTINTDTNNLLINSDNANEVENNISDDKKDLLDMPSSNIISDTNTNVDLKKLDNTDTKDNEYDFFKYVD